MYKTHKLIAVTKLQRILPYIGSFEDTPPKFRILAL